ncbi:YpmS family protein [Limosilactobacillus antri]|uniref:YpmS family protein n=1 Tax=Limosilactobacillus antri TaxID=227943 RepID=UPI001F57E3E6|nr:YpmS family protein [Limosilactobacillus antri]
MDKQRTVKTGRTINWWKWAFIVLLAAIILATGVIINRVTAPAPAPAITQKAAVGDTSMTVELNRHQVNALAANYLNRFLKDQQVKYTFIVGQQYATLAGDTKFLGAKIRFALNFIPERQPDGNVLLRARGLSIGRLNIPVKIVMGYIAKNYNVPKWVKINAKKKTILLDLNQYSAKRSLKYSAEEINMAKGRFKFLITVPAN